MHERSILFQNEISRIYNGQISPIKPNITYILCFNHTNQGLQVIYKGDLTSLVYADFYCGIEGYLIEGNTIPRLMRYGKAGEWALYPIEILPRDWMNKVAMTTPIFLYHSTDNLATIPTRMEHIYLTNLRSLRNIKGTYVYPPLPPPANKAIEQAYQSFIPDIKLSTSQIPIFIENNRPNGEALNKLYKEFMMQHDDKQLEKQYNHSDNYCHIRAHLIVMLLKKYYGIQALKIYKRWNRKDWEAFPKGATWSFHCAALIITDDFRVRIWDCWMDKYNKNLWTLKQWVYYSKEPIPYSVEIAASAAFGGHNTDFPHAAGFYYRVDQTCFRIFQALASLMIPNEPEQPLIVRLSKRLQNENEQEPEKKNIASKLTRGIKVGLTLFGPQPFPPKQEVSACKPQNLKYIRR